MAWPQSGLGRQVSSWWSSKGCFHGPQVVDGGSSDNCSNRAHEEGRWTHRPEGWADQELHVA